MQLCIQTSFIKPGSAAHFSKSDFYLIIMSDDKTVELLTDIADSTTKSVSSCEIIPDLDVADAVNDLSEEPENIAASVKLRQRAFRLKVDAVAAAEQAAEAVQAAAVVEQNRRRLLQQQKQLRAEKNVKRQAIWTAEEVRFFFESLKMYGKNFFEISRHIRLRVRSAGITMKTKEQVRLFYYRNWNIIKPCITFDELVSPLAQELYGLINYGVFRQVYSEAKPLRWQPFPKLKKRHKDKLNELVNKGCVKVKIRGKNRIAVLRTPLCQALKRLNFIETPRPLWQYPEAVSLEFLPRSSVSFARVQAAGHNPRVRVRVSVNRQLSDVLEFLKKKWMTGVARMREAVGLPASSYPQLRVMLPNDTRIEGAVSISSAPRSDFRNVTLESHVENIRRNQQLASGSDPTAVGSESSPRFEVDLRDMATQLKSKDGLDVSAARQMKILALYLALGCPEAIQLEYEYRSATDLGNQGGSNSLRRLLDLTMHEHSKMKERRSKDAELLAALGRVEKLRAEVVVLKEQLKEAQKKGQQQQASHLLAQQQDQQVFRKPRPPLLQPAAGTVAAGSPQLQEILSQMQAGGGRSGRGRLASAPRPIVVQRQLQVGGPPVQHPSVCLPTLTPGPPASDSTSANNLLDRAYELAMSQPQDDAVAETSFTSLLRDMGPELHDDDSCSSSTDVLHTPKHPSSNGGDSNLGLPMFSGSTPIKSPLRMFSDMSAVDQALSSMFSENSSDYVEKFADLANHIGGRASGLTPRKDV